MRPILSLEPFSNSYLEILKCFNKGEPLSCDQLNYLRRYHAKISDPTVDYILRYYKLANATHTFLKANQVINYPFLQELYEHITTNLQAGKSSISLRLKKSQYFQFKLVSVYDLDFGISALLVAPFFSRAPRIDLFLWRDLFAMAKYEVMLDKKNRHDYMTIIFEKKAGRTLEQCIDDYHHQHVRQPELSEASHSFLLKR